MTSSPGAEPLSPEDATLLCVTTPQAQLQIGALCRFEGASLRDADGTLRVDDLRAHVGSRLHLLPRFRQRLQPLPFELARPVWVDDTSFDLDRHLRIASLPAPGGAGELRRFLAELLGNPLDDSHPLWELWMVDGLDDGDVAVILRVHHVVADGLSLLEAASALLDLEPDPRPEAPPPGWTPDPGPSCLGLIGGGLLERGRRQVDLVVDTTRQLIGRPGLLNGAVRSVLSTITPPLDVAPRVPLTGRVGTRRDFVWTSLPLGPLKDLAGARHVTLNDVVLTVVTGALRGVLGAEGAAALSDRPPKVLVPVGDTTGGEGGNAFSFMVTALPVHLDRPHLVLDRVHEDMQERKSSRQSADVLPLFSVVDVVPVPVLRRLAPEILVRQPFVNLAVTNLPGSPLPLYLLGSRLRELQPIVTGVGNIACIVGVLSYCDDLGVGITVDPDVVADPDAFLDALRASATELLDGPAS